MTDTVVAISGGIAPSRQRANPMSLADEAALRSAVASLERQSFATRLGALAGRPIELLGAALPATLTSGVGHAVDAALRKALDMALTTLPREATDRASGRFGTALVAASGALGGAFGLAALPVELPVSTVLMLRSIAAIARREGEDLSDPATALACLEVFALGGTGAEGDLARSGYLAVRGALAKSMGEAAKLAAGRGFADKAAPAVLRYAAQIASRFGMVVSQKVAATAVPVLGALGGAAVNAAFMEHFRGVAGGHFTVRRLERTYGQDLVRASYEAMRAELAEARS